MKHKIIFAVTYRTVTVLPSEPLFLGFKTLQPRKMNLISVHLVASNPAHTINCTAFGKF